MQELWFCIAFQTKSKPTGLFEVCSLGACGPVSVAVIVMGGVPAGEDHEALVGEAQLDVAVQVGATPERITQGRLPAAHLLSCQLGTLIPPQVVEIMDPAGP